MKPKFKIGDKVKCPKTLYNETEGKITNVDRVFQKTFANGVIDESGLMLEESGFDSIRKDYKPKYVDSDTLVLSVPKEINETWDGNVKTKHITPAHKQVYKFCGYVYTVKTPKMNTIFSGTSLKLKRT